MVDKQIVKHLKIRFDECRRKYQDGAQTRCYQTYEDWQNTREDFLVKCKWNYSLLQSYERYLLCTKYNMLAESLKTNLHSAMNTTQLNTADITTYRYRWHTKQGTYKIYSIHSNIHTGTLIHTIHIKHKGILLQHSLEKAQIQYMYIITGIFYCCEFLWIHRQTNCVKFFCVYFLWI